MCHRARFAARTPRHALQLELVIAMETGLQVTDAISAITISPSAPNGILTFSFSLSPSQLLIALYSCLLLVFDFVVGQFNELDSWHCQYVRELQLELSVLWNWSRLQWCVVDFDEHLRSLQWWQWYMCVVSASSILVCWQSMHQLFLRCDQVRCMVMEHLFLRLVCFQRTHNCCCCCVYSNTLNCVFFFSSFPFWSGFFWVPSNANYDSALSGTCVDCNVSEDVCTSKTKCNGFWNAGASTCTIPCNQSSAYCSSCGGSWDSTNLLCNVCSKTSAECTIW